MQSMRKGRDFIVRHGETVFNVAQRMQGDHPHTPLTRAGFGQADAMGAALRDLLGPKPPLTLWSLVLQRRQGVADAGDHCRASRTRLASGTHRRSAGGDRHG